MPYFIDILLVLILTGLVFFGQLLLLLPKRIRLAVRQNCRRSDGSFSHGRARIEFRGLVDVSGDLLIGFLLIAGLIIGPTLLVHNSVIPLSMAADIVGAYNSDSVQWEANIETGELGDVGAQYENWGAKLGFSQDRLRFWQEFLWDFWPLLLLLTIGITALFYLFITRYYFAALDKYTRAVFERRAYYKQSARKKGRRARRATGPIAAE